MKAREQGVLSESERYARTGLEFAWSVARGNPECGMWGIGEEILGEIGTPSDLNSNAWGCGLGGGECNKG